MRTMRTWNQIPTNRSTSEHVKTHALTYQHVLMCVCVCVCACVCVCVCRYQFRLHRNSGAKTGDALRMKLDKVEAQLKELRGEGGRVDSRGSRLRGRIGGGLL